jgi:hypothetical protein
MDTLLNCIKRETAMPDTFIDDNFSQIERLFSAANDQQKARLEVRLLSLLSPRTTQRLNQVAEDDDDLFDNMPV